MNSKLFSLIKTRLLKGVRFQNNKSPEGLADGNLYMVMSTGNFTKSGRDQTQPKISVLVKKVDINNGEIIGEGICITISSISGGFMRVGHVIQFEWFGRNARVRYERKYPVLKLKINCHRDGWHPVRPDLNKDHFIPESIHNISSDYDSFIKPSPYIKFDVEDFPGINHLYVSCFELFMRTYGSSGFLKRILLTYDFKTAMGKLTEEYDTNKFNIPGEWVIKPKQRVTKHDLPLLAAMKYQSDTINIVRSIYNKIVTSNDRTFPWISPWSQERGTMTVSGIKITNNSFVGLRIDGMSVPDKKIYAVKTVKRYDSVDGEIVDEGIEPEGPPKERKILDDDLELCQDEQPSDEGSLIDLEETALETDSLPVIEVLEDVEIVPRPQKSGTKPNDQTIDKKVGPVSPGEPTSDPSDNDEAAISTPVIMESKGTLSEIWNDFLKLHHAHPEIITKIEHYNFQDGLCENDKPSLIVFPLPKELTNLQKQDSSEIEKYRRIKTWVTLRDIIPRGMLVIKVSTNTRKFYCIEMQREIKSDKSEEQDHFKGLYFYLDKESELDEVLNKLLKLIPNNEGKFNSTMMSKTKVAFYDTYQHYRREKSVYFFGHALQKILNSMDIDITIELSVKHRKKL
jgi:hypothetical protein